jgi:hypothetical protein
MTIAVLGWIEVENQLRPKNGFEDHPETFFNSLGFGAEKT